MARSPLFDIYDPYGTTGAERIEDLLPEEEKAGLLRRLANMGSSGLSAFGWLLDTPGAFVRGTLAGDPLSVFGDSERRVTGRELLRQYGLAGSEDNWANFAGGTAAEIALDPLTYASLGLSAIFGQGAKTAAYRAAAKAGLIPDDIVLAADRAGFPGRATYLRNRTPAQLIEESSDPTAARLAWEDFIGPGQDELLNQPLARSHRVGLPWGEGTAVDLFDNLTGASFGDWAARQSDRLRSNLFESRLTGPAMRSAQAMFDSRVMGFDNEYRMTGRALSEANRNALREADQQIAPFLVDAARDLGEDVFRREDFAEAVFNTLENQLGQVSPEMQAILQTEAGQRLIAAMRGEISRQPEMARALGLRFQTTAPVNQIDYFPRQAVYVDNPTMDPRYQPKPSAPARGPAVADISQGGWAARDDYTRSLPRWLRNKMTQDAGLQAALRDAPLAGPDNLRSIIDDWMANNARNLDGSQWLDGQGMFDWMDEGVDLADEAAAAAASRKKLAAYQNLADALRRTPLEFAQQGLPKYGNVFSDLRNYMRDQYRRRATANVLLDAIIDPRIRVGQAAELVPGGTAYSAAQAGDVLGFDTTKYIDEATGLETTPFNEVLARRLQVPASELANMSFDKAAIDQFNQRIYGARAPRESRGLFAVTDKITDLFKTLALASVSRHVRDLYSGSFAAATQGAFNPLDALTAAAVAGGNYKNLPARLKGTRIYNQIQQEVQANPRLLERLRRSPRFAGQSDDDLIDELVLRRYLTESGGLGLTSQTVSDELGRQASNLTMQEAFPGGAGSLFRNVNEPLQKRPFDWRTWIPFTTRGRAGNPNYLLDLSDRAASWTDAANRGGTYLNRIRRGDSPIAAKRAADLSQVLYGPENFTQFERDVMTRLFPFYRFTRGITPLVFQELTENPAGLMGQSVRLVNRLGEPSEDRHVPEYLRQSAAIPLDNSIPLLGPLLGVQSPGVTRFLTNIDLPHEGLLNLLTPGAGNTFSDRATDLFQNTGSNILGQANPLIKGPLEMILNRQFYSGRQLSDLYSVLEQPFSHIGLGGLGRTLEQVGVNLPGGSRAIGLYRNLTDERISPQEKAVKLLFNTITGAKVQDVDQDRTVRLAARTMLNDLLDAAPGVSTFENLYVKPEDLVKLSPEQQQQYLLYRALQSEAARRNRERKAAAEDPLSLLGVR